MGVGGRPGKFPATVLTVTKNTVTFKADPEYLEYLTAQIGEVGTLEWTPSFHQPGSGAPPESTD